MAAANCTNQASRDDLTNAVEQMDALSQDGFSEIATIAKLALLSLEQPRGYLHIENIAIALKAIWSKADDIKNCINCEAESVGYHYIDDAQRRRITAMFNAVRQGGENA